MSKSRFFTMSGITPRAATVLSMVLLPLVASPVGCGGDRTPDGSSSGLEPDGAAALSADGGPSSVTPNAFAPLDAYLDGRLAAGVSGFSMQIFDSSQKLVYECQAGSCATTPPCPQGNPPFARDLTTGVASVSKWITSTTVLATLDDLVASKKYASIDAALDAKVIPSLACTAVSGPTADITLRQLLSFTSGVLADHPCIDDKTTSVQKCACTILADSTAAMTSGPRAGSPTKNAHPPGTTYKYGSSHLAIVGAVVEALAQRSFAEVFEAKVKGPIGAATMVYTNPKLLAGSLKASPADIGLFVGAVFHDGLGREPKRILSKAAVDAQRANQMPMGVVPLLSPQPGTDYGLNNWRWCYAPFDKSAADDPMKLVLDPTCSNVFQAGHGGKGGYMAWADAAGRYYAVFAMREESPGGGADYTNEETLITTKVRLYTHLAMSP